MAKRERKVGRFNQNRLKGKSSNKVETKTPLTDLPKKPISNFPSRKQISEQPREKKPPVRLTEEQLLKTIKAMSEKNTNFIFTFGYTGSSKTTVLAALSSYMRDNYISIPRTDSVEGNRHVNKIIAALKAKEFPAATPVEKVIEYDVAFRKKSMQEWLNLTFLEASGEQYKKIKAENIKEERGAKFSSEIDVYLKHNNELPVLYLLIVGYQDLKDFKELNDPETDQDALMREFIGYLINNDIDVSKVALIISKYDRDKTKDEDFEKFVKTNLPATYNLLDGVTENPKIFSFSVGTVTERKNELDTIEKLNLDDCKNIIEWILELFAEDYVPEPYSSGENRPWWNPFKWK